MLLGTVSTNKNTFCMFASKGLALWRGTSLKQHRRALGRGLAKVNGVKLEIFAVVLHRPYFFRIGKYAFFPVSNNRVIIPAALP